MYIYILILFLILLLLLNIIYYMKIPWKSQPVIDNSPFDSNIRFKHISDRNHMGVSIVMGDPQ